MSDALQLKHPACGTVAVNRSGEWWCPKCRCWIGERAIKAQLEQHRLKALEQFLPKLPPRQQLRPGS